MENIQKAIVTLLHYNTIIRDTLEYTIKKKEYNLDFFNFKKKGILVEIEQNTPLRIFLDKAGENGEKLTTRIKDFYETLYGDDSTILRIAPDGLRVDHAQHLTIYEQTLILHEEIRRITNVHVDFAKKNNQFDKRLEDLIKADERFYRGLVYMTMINDLEVLYFEYNKARNEAKGELTPQSNFIQNDISKVTNLLNFTRQNSVATDLEYMELVDKVFAVIENISGKRDLPIGKNYVDVFKEAKEAIAAFVKETEFKWRDLYNPVIKELLQESKISAEKPAAKA
ncbi:MAG: hypothetical protein WCX85_04110 [Bacilli bacterium]|jgi:hypothetical protein|nr:hypothetical protein [Bacilli bacterium]